MTDRLDPDRLAALEEERDFLLQSLDDLDAELSAGDIDGTDHGELTDDYTRRTAEVLRSIDEQREAMAAAPRMPLGRKLAVFVGIVLIATLAGVLLARASGFRTPSDSVSGNIRQSSVGLLAEADTLTREGRWDEAIDTYEQVLEIDPVNVEALTYRGWLQFQNGVDVGIAEQSLIDATANDPDFADARVFLAIIYSREMRWEDSGEQLRILDGLEAPGDVLLLVDQSALRPTVMANRLRERFGDGQPVQLDALMAPNDDIAFGALALDAEGESLLAVRVWDAILAVDPDNQLSLVGKGRRLALTQAIIDAEPTLAAEGLALLDRAVDLAPDDAEARVWRGLARARQGDIEGAAEDLERIDALGVPPGAETLVAEIRQTVLGS